MFAIIIIGLDKKGDGTFAFIQVYYCSGTLPIVVIFGFIGISKRKKIRKLINGPDKLLYLSEQLTYSQIVLKNYPEKFFSIEKMDKLFQRIKALLYIGIGSILSFLYLIFETFDYTNLRMMATFIIIVYIIYLYIQRKLFQMRKETLELVLKQLDNLNENVLNKIFNYSKETVSSYNYTFIGVLMAYVIIVIL